MSDNYEEIINLPHHVSQKHPQMSLDARAAQFAPFAALTGYDKAIDRTGKSVNFDPFVYESSDQWS